MSKAFDNFRNPDQNGTWAVAKGTLSHGDTVLKGGDVMDVRGLPPRRFRQLVQWRRLVRMADPVPVAKTATVTAKPAKGPPRPTPPIPPPSDAAPK